LTFVLGTFDSPTAHPPLYYDSRNAVSDSRGVWIAPFIAAAGEPIVVVVDSHGCRLLAGPIPARYDREQFVAGLVRWLDAIDPMPATASPPAPRFRQVLRGGNGGGAVLSRDLELLPGRTRRLQGAFDGLPARQYLFRLVRESPGI